MDRLLPSETGAATRASCVPMSDASAKLPPGCRHPRESGDESLKAQIG
jgi:hypothetical protein